MEADIFAKIKAGRFLHEELAGAIEQMLNELLDDAFLRSINQYGLEVVDPAKTLEKFGRGHLQNRKQRSGLVRPVGRPESWSKSELLARVRAAVLSQKRRPNLRTTAPAMNYGGLAGGASALGKLLKRRSIDWKKLKKEREQRQKQT